MLIVVALMDEGTRPQVPLPDNWVDIWDERCTISIYQLEILILTAVRNPYQLTAVSSLDRLEEEPSQTDFFGVRMDINNLY